MIKECPKCSATSHPAIDALKAFDKKKCMTYCDYDPRTQCFIIMARGDSHCFEEVRKLVTTVDLPRKQRSQTEQQYRNELMHKMLNEDPTMPYREALAIMERKVAEKRAGEMKQHWGKKEGENQ